MTVVVSNPVCGMDIWQPSLMSEAFTGTDSRNKEAKAKLKGPYCYRKKKKKKKTLETK
jgi:hypothetical protein